MEAPGQRKRDPEQDAAPHIDLDNVQSFSDLIRILRGTMSQRRAAQKCSVSQSRWAQVERGYGTSPQDRIEQPGPDFVIKVAEGFGQDRDALLRFAGYDPTDHPQQPDLDIPQSKWVEIWPDLTPKQRVAFYLTMRLAADPNAVIDLDELRRELGDTPLSADDREDSIR